MSEPKRSWDEIKKLYPDEWVILIDFEDDPESVIGVAAGRVLDHSKSRDEIHERQLDVKQDAAVLFTGKPRSSIVMGLSRAIRTEK